MRRFRSVMRPHRALLLATLAADGVAAAVAFGVYYVVRFHLGVIAPPTLQPLALAVPLVLTSAFWVGAFALAGLYRDDRLRRIDGVLGARLARTIAFGMLVLFFVLFFDATDAGAARLTLPVYALATWAAVLGGRWSVGRLWKRLWRSGVALVPMAVVGDARRAPLAVAELAARPDLGYVPVLAVALGPGLDGRTAVEVMRASVVRETEAPVLETVSAFEVDTPEQLRDAVYDALARTQSAEMLVVLGPADRAYFFALTHVASRLSIPLRFVSNYRPILGASGAEDTLPTLALPPALLLDTPGSLTGGAVQS